MDYRIKRRRMKYNNYDGSGDNSSGYDGSGDDSEKCPGLLSELPFEILEMIVNCLSGDDCLTLRLVNKDICDTVSKMKMYYKKIPYFILIPSSTYVTKNTSATRSDICGCCKCSVYGSYDVREILKLKYPDGVNIARGYHKNIEPDSQSNCHHNYIILSVKNNRYFNLHINCDYKMLSSTFNIDYNIISIFDDNIKYNMGPAKNSRLNIMSVNKDIQYKLIDIADFTRYSDVLGASDTHTFIISVMMNLNGEKIYKLQICENDKYDWKTIIDSGKQIIPIKNI